MSDPKMVACDDCGIEHPDQLAIVEMSVGLACDCGFEGVMESGFIYAGILEDPNDGRVHVYMHPAGFPCLDCGAWNYRVLQQCVGLEVTDEFAALVAAGERKDE